MELLQFPTPSPAALPPIAVGEGMQFQGYGDKQGWVVGIGPQSSGREFVFGDVGLIKAAPMVSVRVVWEDGREVMETHVDPATTYDKRRDNRIAVYRTGEIVPDWREKVAAAIAAKAERDAIAKAAADAASAAGRAECARLSALYPGALVIADTGPDNAGRFAVGADGSVSVWHHGGAQARTYKPGDTIRHGAYNFDYTGTLVRATAKTVFFTDYGKATKMNADKFYSWNVDFDPVRSEERRQEWSD